MAFHSVNSVLFAVLALLLISLLSLAQSFSTVAISQTANGTLICAIARGGGYNQQSSTFLNCAAFPQRTRIAINNPLRTISGIVGGDGFICAVGSLYPSSSFSVMVCWRFSTPASITSYKRIYLGPALKDLDSGNSLICGLVGESNSNSLRCWNRNRRDFSFNYRTNAAASSLSVGENFVCGLSKFGQVRCFGSDRNVTGDVPIGNFSHVKASSRHACAISFDGTVECWGQMVEKRPIIGEFTLLAVGEEKRSCGVRPNGTVICWGEDGFSLPESLRNEHFVAVEAKRGIFCGVLTVNFSLLCWGHEDFDSDPLVLTDAVPGPCTTRNECVCGPLPLSAEYCDPGLMICEPCIKQPRRINLPLPSLQPPPSSRAGRWDDRTVALLVIGCCFGSLSLLLVFSTLLYLRYIKTRGSGRIHDSGSLAAGRPRQQSGGQTAQAQSRPPALEKKLSHFISTGNGGQLEEFPIEALRRVTENFSDRLKIGAGSFGSVYQATLDNGCRVAIKRAETSASSSAAAIIQRGLEDKGSAFSNELQFLSRLNHKNLVRLFGYCEDDGELILVYEYMENGTVYDQLHKLRQDDSPLMSWGARIRIGLDAARGIEYLHDYAVPRVIHRDIKSSNILLDDTWTAKVSDFGLSLMDDGVDSDLDLHAAGTMGYIDPEYYRLQVLTRKSDVYSFGVVLLELLSGRKAIHKNENGEVRNVVDYVVPYVNRDEIHRVLDTTVPPPNPLEMEAVACMGYLAAHCVMPEGRDRPTMRQVAESLDRAMEACTATSLLSRSTTTSSSSSATGR